MQSNFASYSKNNKIMNETILSASGENRQYESIMRMLRQVLDRQDEIKDSISGLSARQKAIVGDIKLDSLSLEDILEVSDSTLYRWRNAPAPNNLPHYIRENGTIYYDFDEVLQSLRKGQLVARGFNRLKAIDNMEKYRDNILKSDNSGSWCVD